MSGNDLADLKQARRKGRVQWVLNCPAHDDRHESLSISNGRDGVAQLRCSEGCSIYEIVGALELDWNEVFSRPSRRPALIDMTAQEQAAFQKVTEERQLAHASACDRIRHLQPIADKLLSRLEKMPVGMERTTMLQRCLKVEGRLRRAEKEEVELRA